METRLGQKIELNPTCNPTLETKLINPITEISIYPNPATTELIIIAPGKIKEVWVGDLLGQIAERSVGSGEREMRLTVSHLAAGMYLVRVVDEDGVVVVRRFVKE